MSLGNSSNQAPEKNNKPQPMLMNVAWANIDRAMPYIGWLSSDNGQVDLTLRDGQQDIKVATKYISMKNFIASRTISSQPEC